MIFVLGYHIYVNGGTQMKRRLPKSFFEKERPRIKNESKQDIMPVVYSADVEKGNVKALFSLPPKTCK